MRLIDADELLKDPYFLDESIPERVIFAKAVKDAPTIDAVEVVRCKECRYAFRRSGRRPLGCYLHGRNGITLHNGNDFCSYGERKEAEHDQG